MTVSELDSLLVRLSSGDRDSLRCIYDELRNPIFRYVLSMIHDYQSAEDILQDTFLTVMSKADQYRSGSNARAWIYAIARNRCIDVIKDGKRTVPDLDEGYIQLGDSEACIDNDSRLFVSEALDSLETAESQIISLSVLGGMKLPEVSECIGIPYGKVRTMYRKALKKLRKYYND